MNENGLQFGTKLFWVTRTFPDHKRTKAHLAMLGHKCVAVPVLEIVPEPPAQAHQQTEAIVFTSANAVRMHEVCDELVHRPVLTVGNYTAAEAKRAGYSNVTSANGDVDALENLIRCRVYPGARILHLAAKQPAGALMGRLAAAGYCTTHQPVYRSRPVSRNRLDRLVCILPRIQGIMIHSPKAGSIVASFLRSCPERWAGFIYCISQNAARPFDTLREAQVLIASHPSEFAIMRLVDKSAGAVSRY